MTTAPLPIEGTYNLRDLGGFRADGGATRDGALFRSDALARLSERGSEQFAALGVTRVIDLRSIEESERFPDLLPEATALIPHPIFPSTSSHARLDIFAVTEAIYLDHADTLAAAITMVADAEPGGATLFHCTAGKDRTGAVAALALLAVGVDRDDVMHDYAASEANLRGEWLDTHLRIIGELGFEVTPQVEQLVGHTPIEAIDGALARVEERHGSVRDYLRVNGVSDETLRRLHAVLVE